MRTQRYTGLGCPDDPMRTATPGDLPWERVEPEPDEGLEVEIIMQALTTGRGAYGLSHADLLKVLLEYVANMEDDHVIHVMSAARDTYAVTQACGFIANRGRSL